LTSTSTTNALSANQGRILNEKINTKADAAHVHPEYLTEIENHAHEILDVNGLQAALDGKANAAHEHPEYLTEIEAHNHEIVNITGLQAALDGKADAAHAHSWNEITDKPTEFAPSAHVHPEYLTEIENHAHEIDDVVDLQRQLDGKATLDDLDEKADLLHNHTWNDITEKPTSFPPDAHNHEIVNITGLQGALDAKADAAHAHSWNEIEAKPTEFPPAAHEHPQYLTEIENHAHAIADVNGLQAALDTKASEAFVVAGDDDIKNNVLNGLKLWRGSQAQYDAIGTKDPNTIYFIV
jgi:hypothetical protein